MGKEKVFNRDFSRELHYTASRSGGPGGQNVNKVNTKVTLRFDVAASAILDDKEKERVRKKLANKITNDDILIISSESERSQLKNKDEVTKKFYRLIKGAFTTKKKRKATKPTKAAREKRLKEKKIRAEKKQQRQKIE